MNISTEVYKEATKRGLDWICTGGGFDFISRTVKDGPRPYQMTLSSIEDKNAGCSPVKLDEKCEVGIALHATGFLSIGIMFKNVLDALDFMQKNNSIYFMPDMYESGKKQAAGGEGLRD